MSSLICALSESCGIAFRSLARATTVLILAVSREIKAATAPRKKAGAAARENISVIAATVGTKLMVSPIAPQSLAVRHNLPRRQQYGYGKHECIWSENQHARGSGPWPPTAFTWPCDIVVHYLSNLKPSYLNQTLRAAGRNRIAGVITRTRATLSREAHRAGQSRDDHGERREPIDGVCGVSAERGGERSVREASPI